MSGLPPAADDRVSGVDVREQGSALRVATTSPHLVSLGTGRLSTAVTLHPLKQGRVTIGSDPTCDIYIVGPGVSHLHCRIENSHGALTLYPLAGRTLLDGSIVERPVRLSQGMMLTIGRSACLRFNNPAEAQLMKAVLPPHQDYQKHQDPVQCYQTQSLPQKIYKDNPLSHLDEELDMTIKELSKRKPPAVPKKPYRDLDLSDSNSDHESRPKVSSIMAKVSKFEYYAKAQQKPVSKSQFYTHENEISPKVFSSNSLTVNTPAKDVLGGKNAPSNFKKQENQRVIHLNENNTVEPKGYTNVTIRNRNKIEEIVRNFDDSYKLPKKINNDQQKDVYGKINNDIRQNELKGHSDRTQFDMGNVRSPTLPQYSQNYSPVYSNSSHMDRSGEAENKRMQAYQDRIKEEEQKDAENARLEEILNMCAEYERQISSGTPITPTEKRSQNKIITNGSLPRSVALNNPNFVQTSDGYYKFDTSQNHGSSPMSRSLPIQRNLSSYENFDVSQMSPHSITEQNTPEVTIKDQSYTENVGRMDEIGIPVYENYRHDLSSPVMIRKLNGELQTSSPIGSPYENVYLKGNLKPKSPNTHSPRTRIKTTFAHKNLPSPQYFVFPTPPPKDTKPNFNIVSQSSNENEMNKHGAESVTNKNNERQNNVANSQIYKDVTNNKGDKNVNEIAKQNDENVTNDKQKFEGIEKQLSLEEDIPMIDDSNLTDDIEFRYSKIIDPNEESNLLDDEEITISKNQSFDDVKKELMADIPELDEFEKDLQQNRGKVIRNIAKDTTNIEAVSTESSVSLNDNLKELREKYESLKEERRKFVAEIHEIKCKMSEIRSQEDDILRELEMEKALIKGEYDSEIAILNIEQKKKNDLLDKYKKIEEDIKNLKEKQEARQNEMRDRVEIATMKVERLEQDVRTDAATVEELQSAQDILDNEAKICEDLEFQHLEQESELLANREDLQNEINVLTRKIEAQKTRILTLKSEANENLTSALDETKVLQAQYVKLLNKVEELTTNVQDIEKELKPVVNKLNDIERTQSPDSAFFTDQNRAKSGEFGYSPQSSDSDDVDLTKISENHTNKLKYKFNSVDQMSQSMIVDIERRDITDIVADTSLRQSESPSKSSTSSKEKKGFWERNFDSLSRRKKKQKSPEKQDIMSQSLNENLFYNDNIENEPNLDRFNSLRNSKKKKDSNVSKSNSSSKIPTFAALGKIIKKDSFNRKKDTDTQDTNSNKNRYVKNGKIPTDNKYSKAKVSPEKIVEVSTEIENEVPNQKGHNVTFDENKTVDSELENCQLIKVLHRKSCGDEPSIKNDVKRISDSGKIPSQDDIDRISKVTSDAPILSSDDMTSLGKRAVDSLMEVEKKRKVMLEEQGCQVIENEREKISELKRRVQTETKKLWDQKYKHEQTKSFDSDSCQFDRSLSNEFDRSLSNDFDSLTQQLRETTNVVDNSGAMDAFNSMTGSTIFEDSSGLMSSSIEELQVRNSRTESVEEEKRSDDSRPLSHASDFSRDNVLSLPSRGRRSIAPYSHQRPLTRYLPNDRDDFDLRLHVQSAGHQVDLCPHLTVTSTSCRGYLHKLGAKFHTWSKRWFVFDRDTKTFVYYWDKSERKPRGGAYFQVIEEVYLDHGNTSKSPSPQTTFIVKTRQRRYYLMAPSGESARMWIDVIFTGAQAYADYLD
ncbi:repetitive organellar protein isoform X4 [Plutella xylostella]|uniref:repetitive organellar protein isoform X1 n=1 Tax=Plutella xylostella TaxID=51655 RepID=UPI0020323937|nr:repetitive organellar protein isoform X1 [Plutella xylostella]XP_048488165.1 repetitive organellar protein isoform X2 [Plutella xylostella]XP_048488166.1 repetitive organellar protein isoform X3 [Plutella xylostella]XP_048488167.1 repetitive organellar protein isoform X4 [Plutella xylostella]